MTTTAARDGPLDYRPLLDAVIALARAHPVPLVLPLVILGLLGGGDSGMRGTGYTGTPSLSMLPFFALVGLIALVILILLLIVQAIAWALTARSTLVALGGGEPDIGRDFHDVRPIISGAVLTFLLYLVIFFVGLVLLVVPGLFVAAALAPWPAVMLRENLTGLDALKRAWALTENHRMPLFLLVLTGAGVSFVASLVLGWIPIIGGPIAGAIGGAVVAGYVILGVVFYERRVGGAPAAEPVVATV